MAYQQHEGVTKVMNAARMKEESRDDEEKKPATPKQAKALRAAGFKVRVKGSKKWRKSQLQATG